MRGLPTMGAPVAGGPEAKTAPVARPISVLE